jgi:hypothetical protein
MTALSKVKKAMIEFLSIGKTEMIKKLPILFAAFNTIEIQNLQGKLYTAKWFDARDGSIRDINDGKPISMGSSWVIPNRPDDKDWALLISTSKDIHQISN